MQNCHEILLDRIPTFVSSFSECVPRSPCLPSPHSSCPPPAPFLDTRSQAMETRVLLNFKEKFQVAEASPVKDYENDCIRNGPWGPTVIRNCSSSPLPSPCLPL